MKLVGKVKEAHGLKGELYILIFSGDISWLKELNSFELRKPGDALAHPFEVERAKGFKKGFILKSLQITDRTAAESYHGFEFYIPADLLVSQPGQTIYLNEILEFTVKDSALKEIGPIRNFSTNGAQDLLIVETPKGLVEIPFVAAFIQKIDFQHRTVVMDLPEGLLDLESI